MNELNFDRQLNAEIYRHCNDKPEKDSFPVELPVSLPTIKINEITLGDSLELTCCVPAKADLILEDMPYNTTACDWDKEPIDLHKYWESRMKLIKPTGVICLTASQPFTSKLVMSNHKMFKYEIIWDKKKATNMLNAKHQPLRKHENILVFYSGKCTYNPQKILNPKGTEKRSLYKYGRENEGGETVGKISKGGVSDEYEADKLLPTSIYEFSKPNKPVHPTQKPVGLFEYLIRTYTNEGDLVFDGFGGSGTTAIAAHRTKRNFIVIEKDKKYFEIASKRLYQERNPLSNFDEAS